MKNIIITISLITISFIGFAQRQIPMAKRYCPKMENQITKEDSLSDESGKEYFEREFQGVEEDTATINAQFRKMETLQEKNMTPVEKPDGPNLEEIYWLNMDDIDKIHKEEEKKKEEEKNKSVIKPK